MGRKALKACLDHIALEISDAVDVTAAFLRAVAYRFVFDEARVDEGKVHHRQRRCDSHGAWPIQYLVPGGNRPRATYES